MSDVGLSRSNNQDSLVVELADGQRAFQQLGHLFVVADGMGAHAAGEVASKLAVETVSATYRKLWGRAPHAALAAAMQDANAQIYKLGQSTEDFGGMGTTLSALAILPQGALVAHVGDSRVYRLRANQLEQLTFDHSLVWEVCAAEGIPEAEAPSYIPKNVITRSVGPHPEVQVDLEGPLPIEIGDTFLLCSDGLSGLILDKELGTFLSCLPPDEAVQVMVDLAILRGGPDNITGVAVRVTGPQVAEGTDESAASDNHAHRPVHPLLWTLLAVLLLASVGSGANGYYLAALAGLVGAAITGVIALMYRRAEDQPANPSNGQQQGNGPYTALDCTPDDLFVAHLAGLIEELHNTAVSRNWTVDWNHVSEFGDRAAAATEAADYALAVREHCRTISFVTAQLRGQPGQETPGEDAASA